MISTFSYSPENVCTRKLEFTFDDDTIVSLKVIGGCPGNTLGISKLIEGRKIDEVIELFKGTKCPGSKTHLTSCPDQIADALEAYKAQK